MTGLEKILKHIEDDATASAEAVISEAKSKAKEINAAAQAEGEKRRAEIAERSRQEIEASLSRAESAAILREKKLILDAKQQIISDVINSTKELLANYKSEEYFDVIIKMVQKYALSQVGQIEFSASDKKRLPEQFEATLQKALLGIDGAVLSVSEKTNDIDGGFILIYGNVEVNCTFDALFFAMRETLQDKVCEILFE